MGGGCLFLNDQLYFYSNFQWLQLQSCLYLKEHMFCGVFQSFIIYIQGAATMDFVLLGHRSLLWKFLRQTKVNRDTLAIDEIIILTIMQNKNNKIHSKLKKIQRTEETKDMKQ